MTSTRRRITMAAVVAATALAGSALMLVESIGLVLAITFWAVAALLFGNWYRTSTTPAKFDTEATIPEAHAVDGLALSWTREGAQSYGASAVAREALHTR